MIVSGKEAWKRNVLNADGRLTETGQIAYHVVRQDVPEESLSKSHLLRTAADSGDRHAPALLQPPTCIWVAYFQGPTSTVVGGVAQW